jgi:hypothetical protein
LLRKEYSWGTLNLLVCVCVCENRCLEATGGKDMQYEHGESVFSNDSAVRDESKSQRHATTTLECSGYHPSSHQTTPRLSKLSEKMSTIGFQVVEPGRGTTRQQKNNSSAKDSRFGSSPVYPPPTPPTFQLSNSPVQPQPDTCAESTGSDDLSASSVNEVGCKKRKLGSASSGGGIISPPLLSPSASKRQPLSPSGVGSGSVASTATTQEFASKTTFVQVDTSSFRELVQKLTGASDSDLEKFPITMTSRQAAARGCCGPIETPGTQQKPDSTFGGLIPKPVGDLSARRPPFKLHERRQTSNTIKKLEVKGLGAAAAFKRGTASYGGLSPSAVADRLSPSSQNFVLTLSPSHVTTTTPLTLDVFDKTHAPTTPNTFEEPCSAGLTKPSPHSNSAEGRKKDTAHFFMHPSPMFQRPRSQPELLTLFPLTSPRASETS